MARTRIPAPSATVPEPIEAVADLRDADEPDPNAPPDAAHYALNYHERPGHPSGVRQITVTWGEEHIQPIQFNGFKFGGISVVADVHPAETVREAHDRIFALLEELGQKQFEAKLTGFLERAKQASQVVRRSAKV